MVSVEPNDQRQATHPLIEQNLDLVSIIARQLAREVGAPSALLADMESAGREGLVRAAQRFDDSRGIPFRRFANYRVRGSMIDAMRREASLPRRAYERLRGLEACVSLNESAAEDLTAPSPLQGATALAEARLGEHLANLATAIATGLLSTPVTDDSKLTALDPALSPEEQVSRQQLRTLVSQHIEELSDQERTLIKRHYFDGDRFDHVAQEMGLSKSWASRLHTRAIKKLTKRLEQE